MDLRGSVFFSGSGEGALKLCAQQEFQPAVRQQDTAGNPKTVQHLFQLSLVVGAVTRQCRRTWPTAQLVELTYPVQLA